MLHALAQAVLAALPFLPSGRGALILILGGLAMLPVSLFGSRMAAALPWAARVEREALRLGLGPCRVVSRDRDRCLVSISRCRTCLEQGPGPCDRERRALELAIHARAPQARVTEVSCKAGQAGSHGPCTFEIRRGRPA